MNNNSLVCFIKRYIMKYWLLAGICCGISVLVYFSYIDVLPSGKYSIVDGDAFYIYVPTIKNFLRNVLSGNNIYYSWNNSLGMNTSLNLAFYGAFNPFNIIFLLLNGVDFYDVVVFVILLKMVLTGIIFQLFEKCVLKIDGLYSVMFAILYSMCAFQISFNFTNFIWMDALYLLPLSFLAINYLSRKGNAFPLCIVYFFSFITHLYMGYIVGIVSFLYFVLGIKCFENTIKKSKYILYYSISVIVAVMMSAVIWLPSAYFILFNSTDDSLRSFELVAEPLDIFNQFFWGNNARMVDNFPNLYCGCLCLILLPFFFLCQELNKKIKIQYGIIFLLLFFSCTFLPFYKVLLAFDAPDDWNYRFSFCLSFLAVTMAALVFKEIEGITVKSFLICCAIEILIYLIEFFGLPMRFEDNSFNTPLFLLINIILFLIWFAYLFFFKKYKTNGKNITVIKLLGLIIVMIECVGNAYVAHVVDYQKFDEPAIPKYYFSEWLDNQNELISYLEGKPDYYRVNYVGDLNTSSDTYSGFNGLSDFCSTENSNTRKTLSKLGLSTSPKVIRNYGITNVTKMLLGVKTDVRGYYPPNKKEDEKLTIDEFPFGLSLAYMVNGNVKNVELISNDSFYNCNRLLSTMCDENIEVFSALNKNDILLKENSLHLEKENDGYLFRADEGYESVATLLIRTRNQQQNTFLCFDNEQSMLIDNSMLLLGGDENITPGRYGALSLSYIKPFESIDYDGTEEYGVVVFANNEKQQKVQDFYVATYDEVEFQRAYNNLSKNQLSIDVFTNGYLQGTVISTEDKNLLFTSIPYDRGWKVWIDGEEKKCTALLDDAFLGIEIDTPGIHKVEMKYYPGWLREGLIVSILGVIAFAVICIVQIINNVNQNVNKMNTDIV